MVKDFLQLIERNSALLQGLGVLGGSIAAAWAIYKYVRPKAAIYVYKLTKTHERRFLQEQQRTISLTPFFGLGAATFGDLLYHDKLLIPFQLTRVDFSPIHPSSRFREEDLCTILTSSTPASILVVGDRGQGKSLLARRITSELTKRYFSRQSTQIPIYISGSAYPGEIDFGSVDWIKKTLPSLASVLSPPRLLHFTFIIDALDELFSGLTISQCAIVLQNAVFKSNVVATCRRSQYQTILKYCDSMSFSDVYSVRRWSPNSISRYFINAVMQASHVSELEAKSALSFFDIDDHIDLFSIPLHAAIAIELYSEIGNDAKPYFGNIFSLYGKYIEVILMRESSKPGSGLTVTEKGNFYRSIVVNSLLEARGHEGANVLAVSYSSSDLQKAMNVLRPDVQSANLEQILMDVTDRGLLTKTDRNVSSTNNYHFTHASFGEHYAAQVLMERLQLDDRDRSAESLFKSFLPNEIFDFVEYKLKTLSNPALSAVAAAGMKVMERIRKDDAALRKRENELAFEQIGYLIAHIGRNGVRTFIKKMIAQIPSNFVVRGLAIGLSHGGDASAINAYTDELWRELEGPSPYPKNAANLVHMMPYFGDEYVHEKALVPTFQYVEIENTIAKVIRECGHKIYVATRRLNLYSLGYLLTGLKSSKCAVFFESPLCEYLNTLLDQFPVEQAQMCIREIEFIKRLLKSETSAQDTLR